MSQTQDIYYSLRPGRGVLTLIVLNVVCWILYVLAMRMGLDSVTSALPITPSEFFSGSIWQPVTAVLIHSPAQTSHLLGNMLFLWIFGVTVEQMRGTRYLWNTYALCGLAGSAAVLLTGLLGLAVGGPIADWWHHGSLGASGAVLGITGVWGGLLWNETRNFFLLGPMKGRTMMFIVIGIQLLGVLSYDGSTSYAAHLGGLAAGLGFGRGYLRLGALRAWQERRRMAKERRLIEERMQRFEVIKGGRDDGANDDGEWIN